MIKLDRDEAIQHLQKTFIELKASWNDLEFILENFKMDADISNIVFDTQKYIADTIHDNSLDSLKTYEEEEKDRSDLRAELGDYALEIDYHRATQFDDIKTIRRSA